MSVVTSLVHWLLLPPMVCIWMALLALWLRRRHRMRTAWAMAVLALVSLYAFSTPKVAYWLAAPLEQPLLPLTPAQMLDQRYQAIVVLGGGRYAQAPEFAGRDVASTSVLERLRLAAHWRRQSGLPILVTGGKLPHQQDSEAVLMARALRDDFRVPVRWLEEQAMSTAENAEYSAKLLLPLGIQGVVLVSHASHLPRAIADFEHYGFAVLPAPTGFTTQGFSCRPWECWTPQHNSLMESRRALHEWLGLMRDRLGRAVLSIQ